ncbi:hypothetical protein [Halomonas sp. M4R1S46]|uniref:hypothetical protein n=1 Tax=Halomonas sp. M4R1S46 TaxID=2982692 RepID=UPI0021E38892|nr:hypothetical protein [Halomonas sp. M4R1S46]UYG06062.1 hypothetical protein OCT48_10410 [Halomonas sp. M4R1S46]
MVNYALRLSNAFFVLLFALACDYYSNSGGNELLVTFSYSILGATVLRRGWDTAMMNVIASRLLSVSQSFTLFFYLLKKNIYHFVSLLIAMFFLSMFVEASPFLFLGLILNIYIAFFMSEVYRGLGKIKLSTILQFFYPYIIGGVCLYFKVTSSSDYLSHSLLAAFFALLIFYTFKKVQGGCEEKKVDIFLPEIKEKGKNFFCSQVYNNVAYWSSPIVISLFLSKEYASSFNANFRVGFSSLFIASSLSFVALPFISKLVYEGEQSELTKIYRKWVLGFSVLSLFASLIVFSFFIFVEYEFIYIFFRGFDVELFLTFYVFSLLCCIFYIFLNVANISIKTKGVWFLLSVSALFSLVILSFSLLENSLLGISIAYSLLLFLPYFLSFLKVRV